MGIHEKLEARSERSWKLFRTTSSVAAAVLLTILFAIDLQFRFASWQLNVTLVLLGAMLLILSRIDLWMHRLLLQIKTRRATESQ